jgi:hypothetical protein
MTFVVAGSIVRNRAWILRDHLISVAKNKPHKMFYVTGDNKDTTEQILNGMHFAIIGNSLLPPFFLIRNTGEEGYTRDGSDGPRYRSEHMSTERNAWANHALAMWKQATHFWIVDSDVLPDDDVLYNLLNLDVDVAGACVPIADGSTPTHMMGWNSLSDWPMRTGEEKLLHEPHIASLVGSCYLIKRIVLESSTNPWGPHPLGEDGYFAERVKGLGLTMMVDPMARCKHVMKRNV